MRGDAWRGTLSLLDFHMVKTAAARPGRMLLSISSNNGDDLSLYLMDRRMPLTAVRPGQVLRICFGGGLLLTAFWIYAPNLLGNRSLDAVINARTIQILSPIE